MVVDPRFYEKHSGRSGDPYARMGEALAQDAAAKQSRQAAKDKTYMERRIEARFKVNVFWWILAGTIAIGTAIFTLIK